MATRIRLQNNLYVDFLKIIFYLIRFLGYQHKGDGQKLNWLQ